MSSDANTITSAIPLREPPGTPRATRGSLAPPRTIPSSDVPPASLSSLARASLETSAETAPETTLLRRKADAWREETFTRTLPSRTEKRSSTGAPARAASAITTDSDTHEVVFAAREGVVALLGNCTLVVHFQPPTQTICTAMARAYGKALTRAEKISQLCIVEPSASRLEPGEGREGIASLLQRFDKRFGAVALISEEDGFTATVVRSIVTNMSLVSRITFPLRIFSNAVNASAWLSAAFPARDTPNHGQLLRSLRELRSLRGPSGGDSGP